MPKPNAMKAIDSVSPGIGGSYAKDPVTGELTLIEPPTAEAIKAEPAPAASLPAVDSSASSNDEAQEIQS